MEGLQFETATLAVIKQTGESQETNIGGRIDLDDPAMGVV
jgi:hypothetical protein